MGKRLLKSYCKKQGFHKIQLAFQINKNQSSTVDPLGRETRYVYNDRGRLVETIRPDGSVEQTDYDFDNNPTASVDAGGAETRQVFDARGRLIREIDPLGNITSFEYDAANQLIAVVDAKGNRTEYEYDELGRQIAKTQAPGTEDEIVTRTEYDQAGNVVAEIDGLGNRIEYQYDQLNRQTAVIDALNGTTITEYDDVGNVLSISDPVNNQTRYTYDARNRLVLETNELGYTRTFEYDAVGNQIATTDRNNRTRSFTYDGLNRQTEENWLEDTGNSLRTISSEYDVASQLIATDDPDSAYTFTYDELGCLLTVDNAGTPGVPNVVLTYTYDEEGNIVAVRDTIEGEAGGITTYEYDELDRVTQIAQTGNGVTEKRVDFAYDAIGQYQSMTRYSDLEGTNLVVESSYDYDEANRLTSLTHSNSSETVAFYEFVYDAASRITQITDVDGTTDYSYDETDQLVEADRTDEANPDEFYTYDANGNRLSSSRHGEGYETGLNNRLVSDGTYNYEYDQEGNLVRQTEIVTGAEREFEWDYRNRLVAVIDREATGEVIQEVAFTYDTMNRRLTKSVDNNPLDVIDGVVTYFVYDRANVIIDYIDIDSDGGIKTNNPEFYQRYLHGIDTDQILAQEDATKKVYWYLSDHIGSNRDLVSSNGAVINHFIYDSFGNIITKSNSTVDTRYLFTGREFDDETKLYYYRTRYYNAKVGRFLSNDPIGFEAQDANLYRYVDNSPIDTIDPLGLYGRLINQRREITYKDGNQTKNTNDISEVLVASQQNPFAVSIIDDDTTAYIRYSSQGRRSNPSVRRRQIPGIRPWPLDARGHIVGA